MRPLVILAALLLALPTQAQYPIPVVSQNGHEVLDLAHTADGSLYTVGTFTDSLALEPDWPLATVKWAAPNGTGVLARFDVSGTLQWAHILEARRAGFNDESSAFPKRITVLPDGSVVLLGYVAFGLLIDLDPGAGEAIVQPQTGDPVAFIVRYSASGAYVWHQAVPISGVASTAHSMGLGADGDALYVLLPPSPDADPGAPTTPYTVPSLLSLNLSDGATRFTHATSIPAATFSSPSSAEGLAAGGGNVYILGHSGSIANARFTLARHDAATGAEIWSYIPTNGRDRVGALDTDASGALYVAGELSSSATGVALDPAAPGTLTHSRSGDNRTFLASYEAAGGLRWSTAAAVNGGAFGSGFDVEGDEMFASGFGVLRAYSTADGSLLRSLASQHGTPSLYSLDATPSRVSVYVQPRSDGAFAFEGLPQGSPPTVVVQLDRATLAMATGVASENDVLETPVELAIWPHPVAQRATVQLTLPVASSIRVVLYDVLGRHVQTLTDGPLYEGRHELALNARTLTPGPYMLVVETGRQRVSLPLVVAR